MKTVIDIRDLTVRDIRGETTPEEAEYLRQPQNIKAWLRHITELGEDIKVQHTERRAEADRKQQECFRSGPEGKNEWFEFRAQYQTWRGAARRYEIGINAARAEAKELQHTLRLDQRDNRKIAELRSICKDIQDFLSEDENITYAGVTTRDALYDRLNVALYSG